MAVNEVTHSHSTSTSCLEHLITSAVNDMPTALGGGRKTAPRAFSDFSVGRHRGGKLRSHSRWPCVCLKHTGTG